MELVHLTRYLNKGGITTPFGGYKESGFDGYDKSVWVHDQYAKLKTIWIDVSEPA